MERFTQIEGGVIQDAQTGLEWLVGPDKGTTWSEARSWSMKQRVGGGKWRLPSVKELKTLYTPNSGKGNLPEVFQTTAFYVWSAETKTMHTAWAFFFSLGAEEWSTRGASQNFRVFAVRKNAKDKKASREAA